MITFDNRGIGACEGHTPTTVATMADDAPSSEHSASSKPT